MNCVALILRTQPYGEADLLVDLFTQQQGRTRVIARGALKSTRRYMGVLEPGALVKVDYQLKRGLPTLGPCDVVSSHRKLRQELSAIRQLYYVLEVLLLVTPEDEPDEMLFSSVVELLSALESVAGLPATFLYAWELRLLSHLGYQLRIQRCPYTNESPDGLSYQGGGAISSSSGLPHWPVHTDTLRKLYFLQRGQYEWHGDELSLSESEDEQLRTAFVGLWSEITGKTMQSHQVFRKLKISPQDDERALTHRTDDRQMRLNSAMITLIVFIVGGLCVTGCQGMGEHLPSQAIFDVQSTAHPEASRASPESLAHAKKTSKSLPHLSNHPQELPQDLAALTQALISGNSSVSVALQVSAKGQLREHQKIYCELNASVLSAEWLSALTRTPINLKQVQSKLWIEHQVPKSLQAYFKNREALTKHLEKSANSSQTKSQLFKPYNPTQDQEGAWVIYFPKDGHPQSLILTKNTSWMCERAWTIAACELNDTLVELTYTPLDLKRNLTSPLQLVLVSAEVHVHPVDE
jgi:DNA repair protein RecO (recombination protein O)